MPKPVCVKCQCFYRPKHNGFAFEEMAPWNRPLDAGYTPEEIRGKRHPEYWRPYKLWNGDLWKCPDCGHEIVVGVISSYPVREHFEVDYPDMVKRLGATLQVNDC